MNIIQVLTPQFQMVTNQMEFPLWSYVDHNYFTLYKSLIFDIFGIFLT